MYRFVCLNLLLFSFLFWINDAKCTMMTRSLPPIYSAYHVTVVYTDYYGNGWSPLSGVPPPGPLPNSSIIVGLVSSVTGSNSAGWSTPVILQMYLDHYKTASTARQASINITFLFIDGHSDHVGTQNATRDVISYGAQIVLGAEGNYCGDSAQVANAYSIPHISGQCGNPIFMICALSSLSSQQPGCSSSSIGHRRWPYHFATHHPLTDYMLPFVALLKVTRVAKRVAIVYQNSGTSLPVCVNAWQAVQDDGLNVAIMESVSDANATDVNYLTNLFLSIQSLNPDGLCLCLNVCYTAIAIMKSIGYTPPALSMLTCVDNGPARAALGPDVRYVVGPAQWDYRLTGSSFSSLSTSASNLYLYNGSTPSARQFYNEYKSYSGLSAGYIEASVMSAFAVLESIVVLSPGFSSSQLLSTLNGMYETSFFGILAFNKFGQNTYKPIITIQADVNDDIQVISPVEVAQVDFIYPMPSWSDRVYVHSMYALSQEVAVIVLVCISCVIHLIIFFMLLIYRHNASIRALSPLFSIISLTSSLVACCATLSWPVENNAVTCTARMWLWSCSFTLFLSPLIARAKRISQIFNAGRLQVTKISDAQLLLQMAVVVVPQLVINAVWNAMDPLTVTVNVSDELRPRMNIAECNSTQSPLFAFLSLGYGFFLLLIACYYAYSVRGAYEMFNDARPIGVTVYAMTASAIIVVTLQMAIVGNVQSIFAMRSSLVILAYTTAVIALFGGQCLSVFFPDGSSYSTGSRLRTGIGGVGTAMSRQTQLVRIAGPGPSPSALSPAGASGVGATDASPRPAKVQVNGFVSPQNKKMIANVSTHPNTGSGTPVRVYPASSLHVPLAPVRDVRENA